MDLRQLNYFRVVAQTQNITKAAKKLYISQPALSTAISRLEHDIGVLVFERTGNSIILTEAGRCFLEHVNSVFSLLDEGITQAKQIANRSSRWLRLASAFGMMRDVVAEYRARHPECEIELTICDTEQILSMLINGEADVGLNLGPIQDSRLRNQVLMESQYFIAVNLEHPLAQKNSVSLQELGGHLLFCSNIAQTYEQAKSVFQKAGCSCNLLKLDEKDVLFEAARKGLGGVFCMPMIHDENKVMIGKLSGIIFIPIHDCTEKGKVVLTTRKDVYFTEESEGFLSFLRTHFRIIEKTTQQELIRRGLPAS